MFWQVVWWIVIGGIVGWAISLVLGRDFEGGCLTYVVVGIITMVVLGLVIRLLWVLLLIGVVFVVAAWILEKLRMT
jgi:uncharacterized membrane protein YeaQ/YmgE (transglycosylase-associated protein family)